MNQLKILGTMQNGNQLMEATPAFLHDIHNLLVYYRTNEEQKKQEAATGKEYVTPDQFAKIVGRTARTVRQWSRTILADASSRTGKHIIIEKNLALKLIEGNDEESDDEDTEQHEFIAQNSRKKRKRLTPA